jgi:phage repressor protein C with HTH and peptisase S24 domain
MPPESERLVERHAHAFAPEPGDRSLSGAALGELSAAVLERGVSFRFRAMGGSMYPMIENGDVLTVAPLGRGTLSLGDVVEFLHPGRGGLRVHRIVGRRNGACLVQGDGMSEPDGWIPRENILGRVTGITRRGRRIRFGLGPERFAIALANRWGSVREIARVVWRVGRPLLRRCRHRCWL